MQVVRPEPVSATTWPGLAEALVGSAGVPLAAVDWMAVESDGVGALVPPAVVTVTVPYGLPVSGTVRLTWPLVRSLPLP